MIIEFLGTSGSGKSSLIPLLEQLLTNTQTLGMSATEAIHYFMRNSWAGRVIYRLAPPSIRRPVTWQVYIQAVERWHTFWFAVQHPRLTKFLLSQRLQKSHRWLILRLYFGMAGRFRFLKRHIQPHQVIFLDEGFTHRTTHLFVTEVEMPKPEQVKSYLELIPVPDLVLWVYAPLGQCLSRIAARGAQTRLARLSPTETRQFLNNAEKVCEIAADYARSAGWAIIQSDNTTDLASCAMDVHRKIIQRMNSQS
mgnify:FL=1